MSANNNRETVTPESLRALADREFVTKPWALGPGAFTHDARQALRAAADEIERLRAERFEVTVIGGDQIWIQAEQPE